MRVKHRYRIQTIMLAAQGHFRSLQRCAAMSALGHKRKCAAHSLMSALPPTAAANGHVCFTPKSGQVQRTRPCLLWAKSEHKGQSNRASASLTRLEADHVA